MLKEHMRVHDNIREYLCAECGKGRGAGCARERSGGVWIGWARGWVGKGHAQERYGVGPRGPAGAGLDGRGVRVGEVKGRAIGWVLVGRG